MTDRAAPLTFQVAIDCAQPHVLADWWAEALRWEVEPQDEAFIRSMVEQGHATDADTDTHRGKLVWRTGAAVVPPEGTIAPRLSGQQGAHTWVTMADPEGNELCI